MLADRRPKHIIMLMLDGFRPDYLTLYAPPNLQRLVREGTWVAEARSVFPATTTTNQTSFVTGALPASTGIPNNGRYDRETDSIRTKLRDNRCPTIAEILREHGWSSVSVNHFMLEGRGVDQYCHGDFRTVVDLYAGTPPGLTVYYHAHTDSVGHTFGPFSPEMREAVLEADEAIGRLVGVLEHREIAEESVLLVASDHGMTTKAGDVPVQPALEQVLQAFNLKVAFNEAEIQPDTELVCLRFGALFLYWRTGMYRREREEELVHALSQVQGLDVYGSEQLRALGADPQRLGDLVLAPREGWALRQATGPGGYHGPLFTGRSTMLFWGKGVSKGQIVHRARITDVVPTLLALAGVEAPATVDGRVLVDVLEGVATGVGNGETPAKEGLPASAGEVAAAQDSVEVRPGSPPYGAESFQCRGVRFVHDCGVTRRVKSVAVVSDPGAEPVGPKLYAIEVSEDGVGFDEFASGLLRPLTHGETEWFKVETPVRARYVRLVAYTCHTNDLERTRIARLVIGSDGEE